MKKLPRWEDLDDNARGLIEQWASGHRNALDLLHMNVPGVGEIRAVLNAHAHDRLTDLLRPLELFGAAGRVARREADMQERHARQFRLAHLRAFGKVLAAIGDWAAQSPRERAQRACGGGASEAWLRANVGPGPYGDASPGAKLSDRLYTSGWGAIGEVAAAPAEPRGVDGDGWSVPHMTDGIWYRVHVGRREVRCFGGGPESGRLAAMNGVGRFVYGAAEVADWLRAPQHFATWCGAAALLIGDVQHAAKSKQTAECVGCRGIGLEVCMCLHSADQQRYGIWFRGDSGTPAAWVKTAGNGPGGWVPLVYDTLEEAIRRRGDPGRYEVRPYTDEARS